MNVPSQTILTNELKLHDYKGVKLSVTFGDADINDGYSYARINFKAFETKLDLLIDKPILNFIADGLTLNDNPVWNMAQQGPNTGMNSDMVDGLHAYDLKDRLGSHHYIHMVNSISKKFVKIATLTPRRVGTPADFRTDGKSPYTGIFSSLALRDKIGEFNANTPFNLEFAGNTTFQSTDMVSEGAYNSCLRGSVTILNDSPSTIDFHIGLFSDPTESSQDGWSSVSKFFYASTHDANIPFINNGTSQLTPMMLEDSLEKLDTMMETLGGYENNPNPMNLSLFASRSTPNVTESHSRPAIDKSGYVTPTDVSKNYSPPSPFSTIIPEGESYDQLLEIFRLYYIETTTETIDGVLVVTHRYDLYMAIDGKTEFHITPYMSNGAFLYNFEKPITEGELPTVEFLRAKSIYDDRYAYKYHRHQNYETKITGLINEVDNIWDKFDSYVQIRQDVGNAKKVLMTDDSGNVFPANDNFERHKDTRRYGQRVLVSTSSQCVGESEVTIGELSQLQGIDDNIQEQLDDLIDRLAELKSELIGKVDGLEIPAEQDLSGYLKKTGGTMTGNLTMSDMAQIKFSSNSKSAYIYAGDNSYNFGIVSEGKNVLRYNNENSCVELGSSTLIFGTKKLSIGSSAPAGAVNGDVWIKNS